MSQPPSGRAAACLVYVHYSLKIKHLRAGGGYVNPAPGG